MKYKKACILTGVSAQTFFSILIYYASSPAQNTAYQVEKQSAAYHISIRNAARSSIHPSTSLRSATSAGICM